MNIKKIALLTTGITVLTLILSIPHADASSINKKQIKIHKTESAKTSEINGSVLSINGNSITITKGKGTSTIYTIDASGASVTKAGATTTVSSIVAGDKISVKGTIIGTNVTAETIHINPGIINKRDKNHKK